MIKRVHHVGVAVQELASGFAFWRETLGLPLIREAEVKDQGVRAALLACGSCEIELLEPTGPDTPVGRFLARRGEGLHHLCFESDDVAREVKRFFGTGVEMIDTKPRKGLAGLIAFVHPRACAGILIEMATPTEPATSPKAPLTVTAVHLIAEDVQSSTHLYRDLFGLPILMSHPEWFVAQLGGGEVALQLSSTTTTSGKPGLSLLRLATGDLGGVAARLEAKGLSFRREAVGLVLGPGATRGVPLIVHQRQS